MRSRRTWIFVAWALLIGLVVAVASQGCGPAVVLECPRLDGSQLYDPWCPVCTSNMSIPGCNRCIVDPYLGPSFACCIGSDGGPKECPDGGKNGPTGCAGDCVPAPPAGWDGPLLFWSGTQGPAPACPSNAPVTAYQGHDGLVLPDAGCAPCTCSAPSPSGTCTAPVTITASASPCDAGAGPARDFGAPSAWDGTCTAFDSIPAGALCNGAPCAVSLTSSPLVLAESTCKPSLATLVDAGPPTWSTPVLACLGVYPGSCHDVASTCAPSAAQAPGFLSCIFHEGDRICPAPYLDKHLAYTSFDAPGCTPCLCGPPDSSCTGTLDLFEDAGCPAKEALAPFHLSSAGPRCYDLPEAGVALGSKRLVLSYDAGACAPSGGEQMDAGPSGASTFCCLVGA